MVISRLKQFVLLGYLYLFIYFFNAAIRRRYVVFGFPNTSRLLAIGGCTYAIVLFFWMFDENADRRFVYELYCIFGTTIVFSIVMIQIIRFGLQNRIPASTPLPFSDGYAIISCENGVPHITDGSMSPPPYVLYAPIPRQSRGGASEDMRATISHVAPMRATSTQVGPVRSEHRTIRPNHRLFEELSRHGLLERGESEGTFAAHERTVVATE